jgi:hypothetical protein
MANLMQQDTRYQNQPMIEKKKGKLKIQYIHGCGRAVRSFSSWAIWHQETSGISTASSVPWTICDFELRGVGIPGEVVTEAIRAFCQRHSPGGILEGRLGQEAEG